MKITKNKVVSVTYSLDANTEGAEKQHIETAGADRPLTFLFGSGGLIPTFEANLEGLTVGDSFTFSIDAAEAYGLSEPEAIIDLPLDIFKVDGVLDMSMLKTGNIIPMNDREGNRLDGKVVEIGTETVKMDFNHPLAGHQLHFSGEVKEVRDASEEELSHGHAHTGEHGH
ncbi:MAG TPA: FKBP-type peptidyl-prolyl cis-trans isomerase [Bacteroidia bacterium]|nr:FKBP-type peptidyl-prolyl cis-trans isomerase [Bacteroidia bacterium]